VAGRGRRRTFYKLKLAEGKSSVLGVVWWSVAIAFGRFSRACRKEVVRPQQETCDEMTGD